MPAESFGLCRHEQLLLRTHPDIDKLILKEVTENQLRLDRCSNFVGIHITMTRLVMVGVCFIDTILRHGDRLS
jgi:hypothetical protein